MQIEIGKCVALYQSRTRENVCVCICSFVSVYSLACLSFVCTSVCIYPTLIMPFQQPTSAATMASPTAAVPADPPRSGVQVPASKTLLTASSIRFASGSMSSEYRNISATQRIMATGLATLRFAILSVSACTPENGQQLTTARTRVSARTIHAAWSLNSLGAHSGWRWAARPTYRQSSPPGRISCRQRCCRPA